MADMLISASINVTDLYEWANRLHSAFKRANNQKVYVSLNIWVNNEPDQYGNHAAISLNSTKDGEANDKQMSNGKNVYVGNGKKVNLGGGAPLQAGNTGLPALNPNIPMQPGQQQQPQQGAYQPMTQGNIQQNNQQWQQQQPQQGQWQQQPPQYPQQPGQQPQQGNPWGNGNSGMNNDLPF